MKLGRQRNYHKGRTGFTNPPASLSINQKIVFLSPPLVPILRSNNDPEVLWIVARRGAHGDQVRGAGGGQGEFLWPLCSEGREELLHNT